jgi:hypothetical protein
MPLSCKPEIISVRQASITRPDRVRICYSWYCLRLVASSDNSLRRHAISSDHHARESERHRCVDLGGARGMRRPPKFAVERPGDAVPAGLQRDEPVAMRGDCFAGETAACAILGAALEGTAGPTVPDLPGDRHV